MDFISIAEATSPKSLRRFLQKAVVGATEKVVRVATEQQQADDDFSHLDSSHLSSHHDTAYHQSDSILDANTRTVGIALENTTNTPMFSKAAEAELFMLATNFLLCELFFD